MGENIDYTKAEPGERLRSIYPGDPLGDYYGHEWARQLILEDLAAETGGIAMAETVEASRLKPPA